MDICELAITDESSSRRHPWEDARVSVVASQLRREIANSRTQSLSVLDVGCGDAYVARRLSELFPQLRFLCVDPAFTPELRARLETDGTHQLNERVSLYTDLEEAARACAAPVDFVLLLDVIEHIDRDVEFLTNLRSSSLLSPETRLLITVPAFQSLFSNHDVFLNHCRRHTLGTLRRTTERAGFATLRNGYFFFVLLIPRLIQKLMERKDSGTTGVGAYAGGRLKAALIRHVLLADYYVFSALTAVGIKVPGLSCFAVCAKQAS